MRKFIIERELPAIGMARVSLLMPLGLPPQKVLRKEQHVRWALR